MQSPDEVNVYVRRIKKKRHLAYGGAWKVAMADFALAMMALFLVLWIINSSNEAEREAISEYFKDPSKKRESRSVTLPYAIDLKGTPPMTESPSVDTSFDPNKVLSASDLATLADQIERQKLEAVKEQLQKQISQSPSLSPFKNQILLDMTTEGLRIQIVDQTNRPMFDSSSAKLRYYSEDILWELAPLLKNLDYKLSITGHTDSVKLSVGDEQDDGNWLLSASRANSARRALMEAGINKQRIAQVMGMADTAPLDEANPQAPINRRISITLLNRQSQRQVESRSGQNKGIPNKPAAEEGQAQGAKAQGENQIGTLKADRERADNSYDNPPNQLEN